jgi:hypothetical protein
VLFSASSPRPSDSSGASRMPHENPRLRPGSKASRVKPNSGGPRRPQAQSRSFRADRRRLDRQCQPPGSPICPCRAPRIAWQGIAAWLAGNMNTVSWPRSRARCRNGAKSGLASGIRSGWRIVASLAAMRSSVQGSLEAWQASAEIDICLWRKFGAGRRGMNARLHLR